MVAQFLYMFLIELIVSTDLKDFFAGVSSLFSLFKCINKNFDVSIG